MATFAELGFPFPLFEAPADHAYGFAGPAICSLCGMERGCFGGSTEQIWVGACHSCRTVVEASEEDWKTGRDLTCQSCGLTNSLQDLVKREKPFFICCGCLRVEEMLIGKDTEFGLVQEEDAKEGITGGSPQLSEDKGLWGGQFELAPKEIGWNGVRIASEHLWELLQTPDFLAWQGAVWLFCCRQPMTYLGHWLDLVNTMKPEDPDVLFKSIWSTMGCDEPWTARDFESNDPEMYAFRCRQCGRLRANFDLS